MVGLLKSWKYNAVLVPLQPVEEILPVIKCLRVIGFCINVYVCMRTPWLHWEPVA